MSEDGYDAGTGVLENQSASFSESVLFFEQEKQEVSVRAGFTLEEAEARYVDLQSLPEEERRELIFSKWDALVSAASEVLATVKERDLPVCQELGKLLLQYQERPAVLEQFVERPWGTATKFCLLSDCFPELLRVYQSAGYWQALNSEPPDFKNKLLSGRVKYSLQSERRFFIDFCREVIGSALQVPESPDKDFIDRRQDFYEKVKYYYESFQYGGFRQIEPWQGRQEPVSFQGFEARPAEENVLRSALQFLIPQEALVNVKALSFDGNQPPAKTDKQGLEWQTLGVWSFVQGAKFYPLSCRIFADSEIPDWHRFQEVFLHEMGHAADGLFIPYNQVYPPPWLRLRMFQVLDHYDPYNHPATNYVSRVCEESSLSNVEGDINSKWSPWIEQFAEMMTLFRQNPRQFALEYDEEAVKAFHMYCMHIEGSEQVLDLDERVLAWQVLESYSAMNDDEFLPITETADLSSFTKL
jgi:hypothetical protein